jgi:putative membrane protein
MQTSTIVTNKSLLPQQGIQSIKGFRTFLWLLVLITIIIAIIQGMSISTSTDRIALMALIFVGVVFSTVHGLTRYGWKDLLVLFLFVAFWALFWENLSIYTGFPFGHYHYDDSFGPKLLKAPYFLTIAYFYIVYVVWNMAHILLRRYTNKIAGSWVVVLPIVAMFILVMFDIVIDPYFSTVQGRYIWHDGGPFFGVPFVNFMGWYLCTYTMFQSFALYMWKKTKNTPDETTSPSVLSQRSFWLQNIVIYCAWPIQHLIKGFTVDSTVSLTSLDGITWPLSYLLQSSGLIALSTMGFVALMAIIKVTVLKEVPNQPESSKTA